MPYIMFFAVVGNIRILHYVNHVILIKQSTQYRGY